MARTRTLTNLIADVRSEGGYNRSKVFTDALLTRWINQAICEVYEHLANKMEGRYIATADLVTVVGTKTIALPATFWKLIRLDYKHSSTSYTTLRRFMLLEENNLEDTELYDSHGPTYAYALQGSNILLSRTPTSVDTLRIVYVPYPTDLSLGTDTFDGINGYEDLVVQLVLRKCYQREQKDIRPAMMEIERQFARIDREAANRNSAEPHYCPDIGG